jgi:hypothetical protein
VVSSSVTRQITLQVVAPTDGPSHVFVLLRYDIEDPYAVHAVFHVAADDDLLWVFGRELLTAGLDQPSGEGDVRIWPDCDAGRDVVLITLRSPDGEASLSASADDIVEFLNAAYALCPRGGEAQHLKIDHALGALFPT